MPSGRRALVLVPGACLGGWAWAQVTERLRGLDHPVHPVTLTGLGERVHLAHPGVDLDTHVTDVVNVLDYEDMHDAVLVGHSYAGAVITGVADRRPDRLHALVFLDTGPLPDGRAIVDLATPAQLQQQRREVDSGGEGWRWPVPDRATLRSGMFGSAADLTAVELEELERRATPQPFATFTRPLALRRDHDERLRRIAVFCSDGGPDVAGVRRLIADGDARAAAFAAPDWELHELATGHWPMFSQPAALADLLHDLCTPPRRGGGATA
jgi:pimeloyl-ACP methyl ester carboxylesterase